MHFQAEDVRVRDDMDVVLYVVFEDAAGDSVSVLRHYRFDSDHECMGPVYVSHRHAKWRSPEHYDWGGPEMLRSVELRRDRAVIRLNDRAAGHPVGASAFEIAFDLPDERFAELRTACSRCFHGLDWYGTRSPKCAATKNAWHHLGRTRVTY